MTNRGESCLRRPPCSRPNVRVRRSCWRRVLYLADFLIQGNRCLTGFGDVCVTGSSYRRL